MKAGYFQSMRIIKAPLSYLMKRILALLNCLLITGILVAQNPVRWEFQSKKISDKQYEISVAAMIQPGWHIYSQYTPEGGPVPTQLSFNNHPMIILNGSVKEAGNLQEKFEEVFDLKVKYYSGTVVFKQLVTLKKKVKTKITGAVTFMVCNDSQCLPPKKESFSISL
ncbi:MAG: hypothetical protein GXC73_15835 [Chitinophagaceae bacterium]|nr:hypothetical protein [Chitinophagaceae bacterium]